MTCIRRSLLRICLLAAMATAMTSTSANAQGPVYRERWGYLHLENRRAEVFDALQSRGAADVAKVAEMLAARDAGVPFRPVANALAFLRGVEADQEFLMRAALGLFVLPEVVDADSTFETCRAANFSVCLPFTLPVPGAMTFEMTVRNEAGEKVWSKVLDRDINMTDVRMAQVKASVPAAALPDGTYEVEMRTMFDGKPPREHDPVLRWTFHALRGYQARAEKAMATAVTDRGDYEPLLRAQLDGFATNVSRAFTGEAFAVRSDAVRELELLEACLDNLANKRAPLAGLKGLIPTAMPAGDTAAGSIVQPCMFRAPTDAKPHPMVVFATGAPAYDMGSRRPMSPGMRESNWLWRELGDFGVEQQWHVVCCDSPGGGRPYAKALLSTIQALPEVLATGGQKPLLVCDREAAAVVALQLAKFRPHISGVVFVGGGAIPARTVEQLAGLPVRMLALAGYPGSRAIERMTIYVDSLRKSGKPVPDISRLHDRAEPWLFGVPRSRQELAAFATQVFGRR